jgi:hypothetical protein
MGTRCVITFQDSVNEFHVYKHWDGYPEGIAECLKKAKRRAWKFPRFEADEFAAAFIASNKPKEGDVRLMGEGKIEKVAPSDIEYHYVVKFYESATNPDNAVYVTAYEVNNWRGWKAKMICSYPFSTFIKEVLRVKPLAA